MVLRTCIVSSNDPVKLEFKRSVEVVAASPYEAILIGAKAMDKGAGA
jgi:hypothetical protein